MKKYVVILVVLLAALMFCLGMIINALMSVSTLEDLAKAEQVQVVYVSAETMQKAQALYDFDACPTGLHFSDRQQVWVREDHHYDYWVLAHELGHHFAIKLHGDHSEYAADVYGMKILRGEL